METVAEPRPAPSHHALTAAIEYAERGWAVFPCHSIRPDGGCTCHLGHSCERAGKHPRISNGRNGATTDLERIERWWSAWPDSNVAVATGAESGIVVIDIDSDEAAAYVRSKGLPLSLEQRTGSGGTHIILQRPETDERLQSTTRVASVPGLDSRADGGYIIAPPSRHVSGGFYEWEKGVDPAPCPGWWADLILAPAFGGGPVDAPEWNPDGELPRTTREMLEHIPADDYTTWRDVGMALHYTDPSEEGFRMFDWWSSGSRKYDAASVRREWRNWSRRGHSVANPVTLATVRRKAEDLGWTDPETLHGAEVSQRIQESAQLRVTERLQSVVPPPSDLPEPPDGLVPEEGLIGDIARWIEHSAIRPQPRLSLAAAIAFVGALAGRRYASPTNLRTNLYVIGLAPTGAGKNHARTMVQRLAMEAGLDEYLGADHIASGSAIVNGLKGQPVKLYMLDEFGLFLQSLTGSAAAGHRRDIATRLLELYSLAQSSYRGTEYADSEARPRTVIHNPHVCIYGTSTGASFWTALTGAHVLDGTLNRMLIIDTGDDLPPRLRSAGMPDVPEALKQAAKDLTHANPVAGNLNGRGGHHIGERAYPVPMHQSVADSEYEFACTMDEHGTSEVARAIFSRASENAIKLALLHAVSVDPHSPIIGPDSWQWGRDLALWCANVLMHRARTHIARSESEANQLYVYDVIRTGGSDDGPGIAKTELWRTTRRLKKRDLEDALHALLESEAIELHRVRPPGGRGRPSLRYVAVDADYIGS